MSARAAPWIMQHRANSTITFQNIEKASPGPMQDLKKRTDDDKSPTKVDMSAGVYKMSTVLTMTSTLQSEQRR